MADAASRLPIFPFSHSDQVVAVSDIPSGAVTGLTQPIQGFADLRKRVMIFFSAVVEFSVVDAKEQSAILPAYEQYWGPSR